MRKIFLFTLLAFGANAQPNYPSYDSILNHYYTQYLLPVTDGQPITERFVKDADGWKWQLYDYQKETITKEAPFWDAKSGTFLSLDTRLLEENRGERYVESQSRAMLNRTPENYFDLQPYYGYSGWYKDVVDYLEGKKDLSDDQLYALARAYSAYADDLIEPRSTYSDISVDFKLSIGDAMDSDQERKYNLLREEAISLFEKLQEQNPQYETVLGEIRLKASHEYVVYYLDILKYQPQREASLALRRNLYNGATLARASNMLKSCPPNAILFTHGDNDTYPLYYAQQKLNLRPDVSVINISLLNLVAYADLFRKDKVHQTSIDWSLTNNFLSDKRHAVSFLQIPDEGPRLDSLVFGELLDQYKNDPEYYEIPGGSYLRHLSPNVFIDYQGTAIELNQLFQISKPQLLIYSLITKTDRPLCFGVNAGIDAFFGLQDYLVQQGDIYLLQSEKSSDYSRIGKLDLDKTADLIINEFGFPAKGQDLPSYDRLAHNYRNLASQLYNYSDLSTAQEEKRLAALEKVYDAFPSEVYPHKSMVSLYFALCLLNEEKTAQAELIISELEAYAREVQANPAASDIDQYQAEQILNQVERIRAFMED
ncbi:MAG: hypothetical protein DA405_12665 [Bacteroidetes bacterium]|nr:MAG: hypothetical protein DA405_12665 [Bacteroidota bacterium]